MCPSCPNEVIEELDRPNTVFSDKNEVPVILCIVSVWDHHTAHINGIGCSIGFDLGDAQGTTNSGNRLLIGKAKVKALAVMQKATKNKYFDDFVDGRANKLQNFSRG